MSSPQWNEEELGENGFLPIYVSPVGAKLTLLSNINKIIPFLDPGSTHHRDDAIGKRELGLKIGRNSTN
ncbi:hypothetical protein K8I28_17645 [bacterium]|nr:hypothetical protein [bacterium]